jgi:hypothetical protein
MRSSAYGVLENVNQVLKGTGRKKSKKIRAPVENCCNRAATGKM